MTKQLDQGQIAEVKEFYDGSWGSIRELAGLFNVGIEVIRWLVNHNNYKPRHYQATREWQRSHPEATKLIQKRANKRWRETHCEHFKAYQRIYQRELYRANPEKFRKRSRENHRKLKLKEKKKLYILPWWRY